MESKLKIGWASRDISTDKPVPIRGQFYLRISEGILDPITVTALAISSDEDSVIFLSCDATVVYPMVVKTVREKLKSLCPSIPTNKILLNATHTHESGDIFNIPVDYETLPRMSSDEYVEFFCSQAADATVEAWNSRKPGAVSWGYGFATVGHSRRSVYFDDTSKRPDALSKPGMMVNGHAMMYGNTNDPMFSHFEAGSDSFLNTLFTHDPSGKITGIVVNTPCPSQVDEHIWKLSADFWHETRMELRKRFGESVHVLAQCGAAGDLSPHCTFYADALKRRLSLKGISERQDLAERIASSVAEIESWASKDIRNSAVLKHEVRDIHLTRRRVSKEEFEAESASLKELESQPISSKPTLKERMMEDSTTNIRKRRCREIISRYESQDADPKLPMELHVVRLGDIAFASNRFELYMDFAHRIQARSPAVQTFIIQLAGSECGERGGTYLPTERGERGKGYSATIYCNLVNSKGGQELVEETVKSLKALFN